MSAQAKPYLFAAFGLALLIFDLWVLFRFRRSPPEVARTWRWATRLAWLLGLVLFWFTQYSWSESPTVRVSGFPFFMGVFELHDGHWLFYFGGVTYLGMLGNLAVALLTAQTLVKLGAIWSYHPRPTRAA